MKRKNFTIYDHLYIWEKLGNFSINDEIRIQDYEGNKTKHLAKKMGKIYELINFPLRTQKCDIYIAPMKSQKKLLFDFKQKKLIISEKNCTYKFKVLAGLLLLNAKRLEAGESAQRRMNEISEWVKSKPSHIRNLIKLIYDAVENSDAYKEILTDGWKFQSYIREYIEHEYPDTIKKDINKPINAIIFALKNIIYRSAEDLKKIEDSVLRNILHQVYDIGVDSNRNATERTKEIFEIIKNYFNQNINQEQLEQNETKNGNKNDDETKAENTLNRYLESNYEDILLQTDLPQMGKVSKCTEYYDLNGKQSDECLNYDKIVTIDLSDEYAEEAYHRANNDNNAKVIIEHISSQIQRADASRKHQKRGLITGELDDLSFSEISLYRGEKNVPIFEDTYAEKIKRERLNITMYVDLSGSMYTQLDNVATLGYGLTKAFKEQNAKVNIYGFSHILLKITAPEILYIFGDHFAKKFMYSTYLCENGYKMIENMNEKMEEKNQNTKNKYLYIISDGHTYLSSNEDLYTKLSKFIDYAIKDQWKPFMIGLGLDIDETLRETYQKMFNDNFIYVKTMDSFLIADKILSHIIETRQMNAYEYRQTLGIDELHNEIEGGIKL